MSAIDSSIESPRLAGPVPTPEPMPFLKAVRTAQRNFIACFHEGAFREDIIESRALGFHTFLVNDPAGIRRVLLDNAANYPKSRLEHRILGPGLGNGLITSEGETWRTHRRIMAPFFDQRSVQGYGSIMTEAAAKLVSQWDALPANATVEISHSMMELTLAIIARSMFSADSDGIVGMVRDSSERYQESMMFGLLDFTPGIGRLWGHWKARRGKAILKHVDREIHRLIAARATAGNGHADGDLLGRLIAARDEETGAGMSAEEVRDQVFTIFVAGHETTALALTWTWYLLAMHPEAEAKLHAELRRELGGRIPTHEDIARLPYTRMVVQESMRLYPPVHSLAWREALGADQICGRRVPRGSIVSIVPWVLHRHHRHWDRPERFDPERFSAAASNGRDRLSYLPFGFGPRVCIGASFAMTEAILVLATLAQRYRLRLVPGHPVEPQALFTLKARYGIQMTLEACTEPPAER